MTTRSMAAAVVLSLAMAACGGADEGADAAIEGENASAGAAAGAPSAGALAACEAVERMPVEGRPSPFDSTMIDLGGAQAKLCYGRPSMNGRQIYGGLVPYDTLWRTGANEPTVLHLPFPAELAGIRLEPGSYSLYTVPGRERWSLIVNRSTSQWGIESSYTPEVRAQELARADVLSERSPETVEMFTITSEPSGPQSADLLLDWEDTRVRVPIRRI